MRRSWRNELANLSLLLFMFVTSGVTWPVVPRMIPIHWNTLGQADRYGNKFESLILPPLIALVTYAISLSLLGFWKHFERERFGSGYQAIITATLAFLAGCNFVLSLSARGIQIDTNRAVSFLLGMVMMVVGNYFGKLRPNLLAGIRTPWTFLSRESWTKTHSVGGKSFVVLGAMVVLFSLVGPSWGLPLAGTLVATDVLALTLYSYMVWKGDPNRRRLFAR